MSNLRKTADLILIYTLEVTVAAPLVPNLSLVSRDLCPFLPGPFTFIAAYPGLTAASTAVWVNAASVNDLMDDDDTTFVDTALISKRELVPRANTRIFEQSGASYESLLR